ncbi:MAG TPA: energy transducer TonB [Allosphingosinicella sp.]|jgi:TonB family protein|nr:energy transducer TonB [Allosphingosinicella sp.]
MRLLHGSILGAAALTCVACGDKPPENESATAAATLQRGGDLRATRCAMPRTWSSAPADMLPPTIDPVRNVVSLDEDGMLYWNGSPIDLPRLRQYLDFTTQLATAPLFVLQVDPGASCDRMSEIVAMASATLDCTRFCRLELHTVVPGELAPPAPPPVEDQAGAVAPPRRARANLSAYFSSDDYPAAALRGNEQGTTGFSLIIGPNGRVTECAITSSSGHASLDQATCRILRSRARYTPARGPDGNPGSGTDSGRVTWRLPTD